MLSGNSLCKVSNFFRRSDFRALGDHPLRDMSSVPDLHSHRCAWMVFFSMFLEIVLDRLLEFREGDSTLCCNDLEVKLCFLAGICPGGFHEDKLDLVVAQGVKWDALA